MGPEKEAELYTMLRIWPEEPGEGIGFWSYELADRIYLHVYTHIPFLFLFFLLLFFCFVFCDKVLLCSGVWDGTHYEGQAGHKLYSCPLASAY